MNVLDNAYFISWGISNDDWWTYHLCNTVYLDEEVFLCCVYFCLDELKFDKFLQWEWT